LNIFSKERKEVRGMGSSRKTVQLLLAIVSFAIITALVLVLDGIVEFWPLYFVPVVFATFSYDLWGGIVSAVFVDVIALILTYLKFSMGEISLENFIAIAIGLVIILLVGIVFGYLQKSKGMGALESDKYALVDKLTGLYNLSYFRDRLEEEKERSDRFGSKVSVALLNVDYLASFNKKFGYPRGNELLQRVAMICKQKIRAVDIPVRYGGEEFAVIMPNTGVAGAREVAERIRSAVEEAEFEGAEKKPGEKGTISIGVATYPDHARSIEELTELLGTAVVAAKNGGRNKVYVHGTEE
jgi:diguanylate cyclase (GGDEF)-like protein